MCAKRALDIVVSAVLLFVLLPVFAVITLAIKLESRGPVFYRAQRVGRNGRPLAVLKFRKMVDGAHGSALTVDNDDRLTRVGHFLTEKKLDEMPQLWNVLRGGMSFIGPRPEDRKFVDLYPEEYANEILRVRPGITGLTQLAFTHEGRLLDVADREQYYREHLLPGKVALDRLYVEKRSLFMDARIFFWTVGALALDREVAVDRRTGHLGVRRRTAAPAILAETATSDPLLREASGQ
jgi:lipopolysaccharide/colanic/teichoic acid biosynthesis glycosyltransferase